MEFGMKRIAPFLAFIGMLFISVGCQSPSVTGDPSIGGVFGSDSDTDTPPANEYGTPPTGTDKPASEVPAELAEGVKKTVERAAKKVEGAFPEPAAVANEIGEAVEGAAIEASSSARNNIVIPFMQPAAPVVPAIPPIAGDTAGSTTMDGLPAPEDGDGADAPPPAGGVSPDDMGNVINSRNQFLVEQYIKKGRQAVASGDLDAARDFFYKALQIDPQSEAAREGWHGLSPDRASTSDDYLNQRTSVSQVRRDQAATEVRKHLNNGRQLAGEERYRDAVKEYQKALAIISWYDETGDFGTSAAAIRDLIDNTSYQADVSDRRNRQDQIREAQEEKEIELAGIREQRMARIRSWFEGAHRAFRRGEYELARTYAKNILRSDPRNCDANRIIEMSHDAEHMKNQLDNRRRFDNQWKSIMLDLERISLPQIDVVRFPDNWLDDIATRTPRSVGDSDVGESDVANEAVMAVLRKKRVKGLVWEGANLDRAVEYLRVYTGLNFHVTPKVRDEKGEEIELQLQLDDVSVYNLLDVITSQYDLRWGPRGGVIYISMPDEVQETMKLDYYDVKDLAVAIQNFIGQDINLVPSNFAAPEPPELPEPEPIIAAENLMELIKATIGGEPAWEEPASIEPRNNILIVRNTPAIHAQISDLLRQLRANSGILVDLEVRFLTAEDNFLRDVGVDVRGLGSGVNPVQTQGSGPPVVIDDVFFGTSANPSGVPFGTNPEPSSVGAKNDAGIFYNDNSDGAYAGRVENLFDTVVRRFGDPDRLRNTGGLSFQHTYLDDTAVEVILRAVEKSERIQEITAPRITVYNTQRANVSVLNQISYVQDYEVEIAQASNIANPVIQTIQEGVVLDVRPVVSADRRFIQLELRPTVATVVRPIGEFTTNLASGPIGANAPVTLQIPELRVSKVRTTVTMPDGGTLLIGGMKFYEKDVRESGVPILSKIPILSMLLTRKGNFVNRRNLMILVRANVVSLTEREPQDNLDIPPLDVRDYVPIVDFEDCEDCEDGRCNIPAEPVPCPCEAPAPVVVEPAPAPCNVCDPCEPVVVTPAPPCSPCDPAIPMMAPAPVMMAPGG